MRQHVLAHESQDFFERPPVLGQRLVEESGQRPDLAEDRAFLETRPVLSHRIRRQVTQPPDFFRGQIEFSHPAAPLEPRPSATVAWRIRGIRGADGAANSIDHGIRRGGAWAAKVKATERSRSRVSPCSSAKATPTTTA